MPSQNGFEAGVHVAQIFRDLCKYIHEYTAELINRGGAIQEDLEISATLQEVLIRAADANSVSPVSFNRVLRFDSTPNIVRAIRWARSILAQQANAGFLPPTHSSQYVLSQLNKLAAVIEAEYNRMSRGSGSNTARPQPSSAGQKHVSFQKRRTCSTGTVDIWTAVIEPERQWHSNSVSQSFDGRKCVDSRTHARSQNLSRRSIAQRPIPPFKSSGFNVPTQGPMQAPDLSRQNTAPRPVPPSRPSNLRWPSSMPQNTARPRLNPRSLSSIHNLCDQATREHESRGHLDGTNEHESQMAELVKSVDQIATRLNGFEDAIKDQGEYINVLGRVVKRLTGLVER